MTQEAPLPSTQEILTGYTVSIPRNLVQDETVDFDTLLHAERSTALAAIKDLIKMDPVLRWLQGTLIERTVKLIRKSHRSFQLGATPEANKRAFLAELADHGRLSWELRDLEIAETQSVYLNPEDLLTYERVALASLGGKPPFEVTRTT